MIEQQTNRDDGITLEVLFFATLKERTRGKKTTVSLPVGSKVRDLKDKIASDYPDAAFVLPTCLVSINREFTAEDDELPDGAEVALFPPVSGGSEDFLPNNPTIIAVTETVLDINQLLEGLSLPTTGAACVFTGLVRERTSRELQIHTEYLEYEAYHRMAEEKMRQVAQEIRQKWPSIEGIGIVQRIGKLFPGTPTVLIACTAAHRDTGVFEAAHYGIDRLKQIVPIWKKEVGSEGKAWVEGDYFPEAGE